MLTIRRITAENQGLMRPVSDASLVGEDVVLQVTRSGFLLRYQPKDSAEWRSFPPSLEAGLRLQAGQAVLYGAFRDEVSVGSLIVRITERGWANVLDLRVDIPVRRQGIATALMASCERFAAKHEAYGVRLEASDRNPTLCRFAEHAGFRLGGVDTMALASAPEERQRPLRQRACALYFYKLLRAEE